MASATLAGGDAVTTTVVARYSAGWLAARADRQGRSRQSPVRDGWDEQDVLREMLS
jgi:hypothetical protein